MVGIKIGYLTILQTIDKIRLFVNRHGELILKQGDIRIKKQGIRNMSLQTVGTCTIHNYQLCQQNITTRKK